MIYDTDTKEYEAIANPAIQSAHGAGVQAAQLMLDKKIEVVLSGRVGPNSHQILSAAGVDIRACPAGTVEELVDLFLKGDLPAITQAGPAHAGMGGGMGGGTGRGRNR
jgi:predicted Fe-Mo cluster-binding NifX family protein